MTDPKSAAPPTSNLPNYFKKLSQIYPRQTGNSTLNLFAQITEHLAPISDSSKIHDNACGPGTAASVILKENPNVQATILGTDMVPAMIEAFASAIQGPTFTSAVMNSQDLQISDALFTHSITNFSVFNFQDALAGVREIHRTLKPSGQAVITTWKRFGIGEVIHETQRRIRPDLPMMRYSGTELYSGDAVTELMVKAGFDKAGIKAISTTHVVTGEDLVGLQEFASGPFTDPARKEWTEEERGRWLEVLNQVLEEEIGVFGGVKFEGWAVFATK